VALPVTDDPDRVPSEPEEATPLFRRVLSTVSSPSGLVLSALLAVGLFLVHLPEIAAVVGGVWACAYGLDTLLDPWGHVAVEDTGEAFVILRGLLCTVTGLMLLANGAVGLARHF
jgi:hypothetical protein